MLSTLHQPIKRKKAREKGKIPLSRGQPEKEEDRKESKQTGLNHRRENKSSEKAGGSGAKGTKG